MPGLSNDNYGYASEYHQFWSEIPDWHTAFFKMNKNNTLLVENLGQALSEIIIEKELYNMIKSE